MTETINPTTATNQLHTAIIFAVEVDIISK